MKMIKLNPNWNTFYKSVDASASNTIWNSAWDTIRMPVHNSIIMSVRNLTKETNYENA